MSDARLSLLKRLRFSDVIEENSAEISVKASDSEEFDWRQHGAVSKVKDQKSCGSHYAFAAVESIESQHFLRTQKLVSLSEQQVIDCSKSFGNKGCHSGTLPFAFEYIMSAGLMDDDEYPYKGVVGERCLFVQSGALVKIEGYRKIPSDEESLLQEVEETGPVAVMINLRNSLRWHKRGIYEDSSCNSTSRKHAVLIVGYGSEGGKDYWIIKNSWV